MNNAHTTEIARFDEFYIGEGDGFVRIYMAEVGGLDVPNDHALAAELAAVDSYAAAEAFFDTHVASRLG